MRYEKGRKEETRRRILKVAARRFRRDGIAATGIAELMADAGLTHGGFYAHFGSKDELARDAVAWALLGTRDALAAAAKKARGEGRPGLTAIVDTYLSVAHRDHAEIGCAAAALSAELARMPMPVRQAATQGVRGVVAVIAAETPAPTRDGAHAVATAIFGLMMGAIQLARAEDDPTASSAILAAGRACALALARM